MPAKKRLVPPIRPNADGTGFVRAGRPTAPARNRSGGPRRPVLSSSTSDTSSAASIDSRSSSAEAAAATACATVTTAPSCGQPDRVMDASSKASPAKSAAAAATTFKINLAEGSNRIVEAKAPTKKQSTTPSLRKALPLSKPNTLTSRAEATTVLPARATAAAAPRSRPPLWEFDVGVDAALGPSECAVPLRVLHELGMLNGSLVQLSTSYGEAYAEARQMRGSSAPDRVFVNEDVAALLVDKRVRLEPLVSPPHGLPVLTAVTLRPVSPESSDASSSPMASLSSVLEWQTMFRRALHHKIVYVHLRTTQRVLTQRLSLEVVKVATEEANAASTSSMPSSPWGIITDATLLYLEAGQSSSLSTASPALADSPAAPSDVQHESVCTLVVGESGTGKSRWLKQLSAHQLPLSQDSVLTSALQCSGECHVEWVRVEELPQGEGSEVSTATALRETFERARQSAPALLLIDDLHLICAREASSAGSRWAMSLIAHALAEELLDLQHRRHDVCVVASAPSLDSLDECLTGSSLFGQHVVVLEMPSGPTQRLSCLKACLEELGGATSQLSVSETCVQEVAERAHGFTQRDLHRLAETAVVKAFQNRQSVTPQDADLRAAAAVVHPSSLKRFEVSVPTVTWDDIGGSAEAKRTLCDVVEWCLGKQSWVFTEFNLTPPKGVLLYGPPGCSKTMLAKALANESHMNFISVKGPEVFSKWVGDSEKAVRDIFERARAASPCVVFIDELDGMCGHRGRGGVSDRVISQFLTELDGLPAAFEEKKNALVFVAATNRPDSIDGAVLRPGRIDRRVYVGLPSYNERVAIAAIQFRHLPVSATLTPAYVAERTEGYTGAEVVAVVKEAAFHAITADAQAACVTLSDVDAALVKVRPRIQPKDVEWYKQWPHNTSTTV